MNLVKNLKNFFWVAITVVIIFFVLAIVASFYDPINDSFIATPKEKIENKEQYDVPVGNSYFIGSSNPKVTIIEFADFSCPACKSTRPKLKNIFLKNASDIKIVYKDFPVISEDSSTLSLIARCAGEQGLFWETHDWLYENQGKIDIQNLDSLINKLGIQKNEFDNCLSSEKYLGDIQRDYSLGKKFNVKGTPTLFINGYPLVGDVSEEILEKIINDFIN